MADPRRLDSEWLRDHPLPAHTGPVDKNQRGRVYLIGGSALVPGGILLTAEAALRAGAGKVQIATITSAALALGIAMPEAAVTGFDETPDGEIAGLNGRHHPGLTACDTAVVGPAMGCGNAAGRIVDEVLAVAEARFPMLIDAAALMTLGERRAKVAAREGRVILTPHIGEMAALLDANAQTVSADPRGAVLDAAHRYRAIVAFKGSTTLIADSNGGLFSYGGGGPGLATSGSGDILAGIIAGLSARGLPPLEATLWGVWLHGEAGRRTAERIGPIGFLARELLSAIPGVMGAS